MDGEQRISSTAARSTFEKFVMAKKTAGGRQPPPAVLRYAACGWGARIRQRHAPVTASLPIAG